MSDYIYGDRIRQARVLRQRKVTDLAEQLDRTVPALSKWEKSRKIYPRDGELGVLAEYLRVAPDFFSTRPSPPMTDIDLLFKAPQTTLKREINWLVEFVRLMSELLDWIDERRRLPPVQIQLTSRDGADVVNATQELRDVLGLGATEPIDYLTHPVERAGIVVAVRRRSSAVSNWITAADDTGSILKERHEGCSAWVGEFRERPLVIMRGVDTWEKTRWVLAHELGHLSLHAGRSAVSDDAEEQASRFANELIAPIGMIARELPRVITLASLLEVKHRWGISLAALIRHLDDNDVISRERRRTLYEQLYTRRNPETGRSFGVTEPGWNERQPERPRLIAAWLERVAGSRIPEAISATTIFPPDLLASILNEQRQPRRVPSERARQLRSRSERNVVDVTRHLPPEGTP